MKHIEQKRQELEIEKDKILKDREDEIELVRLRYRETLNILDAKIELLAELLLNNQAETAKTSGNLFKSKGLMTVRAGILRVLKEFNHPMSLDELMPLVEKLGIDSTRKTVRARAAKMVGKDIERVGEGVYKLIEK